MKRFLEKFFTRQSENPKWHQVILWWEFRRFIYIVTLLGCITITLGLFELSGGYPGNPFLAVIGIPLGFIFPNIFITVAWIAELNNRNVHQAFSRLLKVGFLFTIISIIFPGVVTIALSTINSEKYGEAYGHFATHEVGHSEMTGTYKIDLNKADYISKDDIAKDPTMILNPNSTFSISDFPIFNNFTDYKLYNARGQWQVLYYDDKHPCQIRLSFDSIHVSLTSESYKKDDLFFYIYNNKPPYKLYQMLSDPDEGAGIIYGRK